MFKEGNASEEGVIFWTIRVSMSSCVIRISMSLCVWVKSWSQMRYVELLMICFNRIK